MVPPTLATWLPDVTDVEPGQLPEAKPGYGHSRSPRACYQGPIDRRPGGRM